MSLKMMYLCSAVLVVVVFLGWGVAKLNAYESAEYKVVESDNAFEIREYPDLTIAATNMGLQSERDRGSFMRLFRYISGANDNEQKVAMTTPVFMEIGAERKQGQMGFVLPKEVAAGRVPTPANEQVQIRKRAGGKFAVIRFKGRMNKETVSQAEATLRAWMKDRRLVGEERMESAGYDPPWKPGRLRRNEVLIRIKTSPQEEPSTDSTDRNAKVADTGR